MPPCWPRRRAPGQLRDHAERGQRAGLRVTDFDDAYYAPFTWDLKRGAVGFLLAAAEKGVTGPSVARDRLPLRARLRHGIASYAPRPPRLEQLRLDNAPPLVADLIAGALQLERAEWLAGLLDESRRGFRAARRWSRPAAAARSSRSRRPLRRRERGAGARAGRGDAGQGRRERKGAGTASSPDPRFVLIEGRSADGTDDLLLELKRARRSRCPAWSAVGLRGGRHG
jgi:uncharacterized protein (DUF2252 family)